MFLFKSSPERDIIFLLTGIAMLFLELAQYIEGGEIRDLIGVVGWLVFLLFPAENLWRYWRDRNN
jgi:hypothetical protein